MGICASQAKRENWKSALAPLVEARQLSWFLVRKMTLAQRSRGVVNSVIFPGKCQLNAVKCMIKMMTQIPQYYDILFDLV
jgi:hypothetical protein